MIKRFSVTLILILATLTTSAQSVEQIKADPTTYIFGEAKAASIRKADSEALADIISQISVSIKSSLSVESTQTTTQDSSTFIEDVESILDTYSNATLVNTRQIIIENEPNAHVFRYIRRSDIARIFDARKEKITNMLSEAERALGKCQINDALRYYYWSHALLKSLQYPNELFVYDQEGKKQMANVWIPQQISTILSSLEVTISEISDEQVVNFNILYNGTNVNTIDYTVFDGRGWSNIYSGQDGKGIAELRRDDSRKNIQLKVEFAFENIAVLDPEVDEILNIIPEVSYRNAYKTISLDKINEPKPKAALTASSQQVEGSESSAADFSYPSLTQVDDVLQYQSVVDKVIEGVVIGNKISIEHLFTPKGYSAYKQLIEYGSARVVDATTPKYYALGNNVYCRNILMNFSFVNNRRSFTESVVLEFDAEKKISNVTFGLSRQTTDDIFAKSVWPEQARIILMHFLEGYKSAYALKQLDYIESVFAEDALIITGSYVRQATAAERGSYDQRQVKLTTLSKAEYVRKLKYIFSANEFININFANTDLIKAGKGGEIYGIQLKQEYHSTSYGDTGYLFLLVDLNNIEKPTIHVRTWQPERDPAIGLYGIEHF